MLKRIARIAACLLVLLPITAQAQQTKEVAVGSVVYCWFAANLTTGAAGDGATPLYDVRLAGATAAAAPTASGTPTLLTHANYTDGLHEVAVDTTGYTEGSEYAVFTTLTISTVNPAGFVCSFVVRPAAGTTWDKVAAIATDLALIPHSNGSASWNATALGAINAEVDTALNTAIPGTPTADSINERIVAIDAYGTPPTAAAVRTEMDANSAKLANLDATVSSRSTYAGGAVASVTAPVTAGTVSDKTGYALATAPPTAAENATAAWAAATRTLTSGGAPSVADIADGVWDEAIAGHAGAGSTGSALSAAGAAGDPWSTAIPGAYGAGTAGSVVGGLLAREATVLSQFGITWGTTYPLVNREGVVNVPRGDVYTISTTLGAAFPLAGRTVYFVGQKRKEATNATAIVNRAMTITDVSARTCTITLTAAETATAGQYHYEIETRDTTTEANPSTAESGTLNIIDDLRK